MKFFTIGFILILLMFVFSPIAAAYEDGNGGSGNGNENGNANGNVNGNGNGYNGNGNGNGNGYTTEENGNNDTDTIPQPDYQNGSDSQQTDQDDQAPDAQAPNAQPSNATAPQPLNVNHNRSPLTGLPINPNISNNRPIAVSFSNVRAALPQHGISQADIIYEMLVEGGITRMLAFFLDVSNVRNIGSIRSMRPYMVHIGYSYKAIFANGGGSPAAMNILRSWPTLHRLDGVYGPTGNAFFRISGRVAPHNLFTTGSNINRGIGNERIPRGLVNAGVQRQRHTFAADATPRQGNSFPATSVNVRFSSSSTTRFAYNPNTNRYYVTLHGNIPYVDGNNGRQVAVTNVLVLQMRTVHNYDREGRLEIDSNFWNWGYFINGGRAVPIYWRRPYMVDQFEFYNLDHTELVLGEGRTYICIVPALNIAPSNAHSLRLHSPASVTFHSPSITLRPPANFTNPRIFLDGIDYTENSTFRNGQFTITPGSATTRTAIIYSYDEHNLPNGMFSWRLAFNAANGSFTATAIPGLTDFLTYVGYSIRITGNSGIRAHNSIRIDARNSLLSAGIGGFRLIEYGTLAMINSYNVDNNEPLVLGGEGIFRGISFGSDRDIAFRVHRQHNQIEFTFVLTDIPPEEYKTDLLFRSYAVLRRGNRDYVFYGPPVPRSIYTVATQVLDAEQFPVGSVQYLFLRNIVNTPQP